MSRSAGGPVSMSNPNAAPPPGAGAAPAAPAAPAPGAPANVASMPLPKPAGSIDFSEPLVKPFQRQYKTDFDDGMGGEAGEGGEPVGEADPARPASPDGKTAAKSPKADRAKVIAEAAGDMGGTTEGAEGGTTEVTEAKGGEAGKTATTATEAGDKGDKTRKPLTQAERRALLDDLDHETERRAAEQSLSRERERIAGIEKKLKGSLEERIEAIGLSEDDKALLLEGLINGSFKLPAKAGDKPTTPEETDRMKAMEDEIARLKADREGTSPEAQNRVMAQRFEEITKDMDVPFSARMGQAATNKRIEVARALHAKQGGKGTVDGVRVAEVVEEYFRGLFVKTWGEEAAAVVEKKTGAPAKGAPATPTTTTTTAVRRPSQRQGGSRASSGKDPLPLRREDRHRNILNEIQGAEGTIPDGPR
jgi:hypothetical protein